MWVDSTFQHSWLKSQTVFASLKNGQKDQLTNHSRGLCAISAEECQHFSGFWSLFGTGRTHTHTYKHTHTHFHTLRAKEMGYYVKDCIFFCRLHASRFSHFSRFCHSLHLLINGLSVRGSREVKLITLIDFEANKPKTRTHPPKSKKKIVMTKNTARDLSDIPVEVQKKILTIEIPA